MISPCRCWYCTPFTTIPVSSLRIGFESARGTNSPPWTPTTVWGWWMCRIFYLRRRLSAPLTDLTKRVPTRARYTRVRSIRTWMYTRSTAPTIRLWNAMTTPISPPAPFIFLRLESLRSIMWECWRARMTLNWWSVPRTAGISTGTTTLWMKSPKRLNGLWYSVF